MVTVFLEVILPVVVLLVAAIAAALYRKIRYPSPLVLGCIIPKVCVVGSTETLRFYKDAGSGAADCKTSAARGALETV